MSRLLPIALVGSTVLVACASAPAPAPGDTTFELRMETSLSPGAEAHHCKFFRVPSSGAPEVFLRGGRHDLSSLAHHYIVFRTTLADPPREGTFDCDEHGAMSSVTTYVTGGQTPHENADFPAAAALPLRAGEVLLLQGHFVNPGARPAPATVDVLLRIAPEAAVERRAGMLRFYQPYIHVPARGRRTSTLSCPIPGDITLLAASAHMHRRGVRYRAFVDRPGEPRASVPFYESETWNHPAFYTGFLRIPRGSTIRYACTYENTGDADAVQGQSALTDEMCMFNAFYYPALPPDAESCVGATEIGGGEASCPSTMSCLATCPLAERPVITSTRADVGPCFQRCMNELCPRASGASLSLLRCLDARCKGPCASTKESCDTCAASSCASEQAACGASVCG